MWLSLIECNVIRYTLGTECWHRWAETWLRTVQRAEAGERQASDSGPSQWSRLVTPPVHNQGRRLSIINLLSIEWLNTPVTYYPSHWLQLSLVMLTVCMWTGSRTLLWIEWEHQEGVSENIFDGLNTLCDKPRSSLGNECDLGNQALETVSDHG